MRPAFTFVDLFAGIGGIRLGLERAGGQCTFSVENDPHARRTYEANFGRIEHDDVRTLDVSNPGLRADMLAAGFPCQPFSLAGVSKKNSLGRAHGFEEAISGNLFFEICRVIDATRPPMVLLENVKNLLTHDGGQTWARIQVELVTRGYGVAVAVIDSSPWVPQRRKRTFVMALSRKEFGDRRFLFPASPKGPGPTLQSILDPAPDRRYTLTPGLWQYLQAYAIEHRSKGNGFGFGLVGPDSVTRTLSARYYKDGSEILITQAGDRPRRLTPIEAALLMGFPNPVRVDPRIPTMPPPPPLKSFRIPVGDQQAYRQFGNSVVPDVVAHIGKAIVEQCVFAERGTEMSMMETV